MFRPLQQPGKKKELLGVTVSKLKEHLIKICNYQEKRSVDSIILQLFQYAHALHVFGNLVNNRCREEEEISNSNGSSEATIITILTLEMSLGFRPKREAQVKVFAASPPP